MGVDQKLINAEMLISRSFLASSQSMFGDSYKAIIRNIPIKYGKTIVEHLLENQTIECENDTDKLEFLFRAGISADDINVKISDSKVTLTTKGCNHHTAIAIEEKFGLDKPRVCPVGIIGTCLIEYVLGIHVLGGKKDPSKYDETGVCTIRFDLFKEI
ncbi:MAG: hypothetical protein P1P80_07315 [ANME-2 cluster archaeon]|nr:hypothetical protein [ANME-2 cluster archaeon]